jgi:hypothetical protein
MSQRRMPGEKVKLLKFNKSQKADDFVQVPDMPEYEQFDECMKCDDPNCREWGNVMVVEGDFAGQTIPDISECQMETP